MSTKLRLSASVTDGRTGPRKKPLVRARVRTSDRLAPAEPTRIAASSVRGPASTRQRRAVWLLNTRMTFFPGRRTTTRDSAPCSPAEYML